MSTEPSWCLLISNRLGQLCLDPTDIPDFIAVHFIGLPDVVDFFRKGRQGLDAQISQ